MRFLTLAVMALALMGGILVTSDANARGPAYSGVWTGTDGADGSNVLMAFGARGGFFLVDDEATLACPSTHGIAFAFGTATGASNDAYIDISVVATVRCPSERTVTRGLNLPYRYDPASDTITDPGPGAVYGDGDDSLFTRVGRRP